MATLWILGNLFFLVIYKQLQSIHLSMIQRITLSILAMCVFTLVGCNQQKVKQNQAITPDSTSQQPSSPVVQQNIESENFQTYTSNNLGISFQYPKDWYIKEDQSINRVYIKNVQDDINKGNAPENFQQVWISNWEEEINETTENNVKNGNPTGREFGGFLSSGIIDRGIFTINTYEYVTMGGPTLEAFWSDKFGKRYYATNTTEAGQKNQQNMVKNLKLILSSVNFIK